MTLEEYYNKFDSISIDVDDIKALQEELISNLSEKDKTDFYSYLHIPLGIKDNKVFPKFRKTKPKIWKFIYSSLPLYLLFTYAGDSHLRKLYNKYKQGDKKVIKRLEDFE